jgi:hypothetical protein
MTIPILIISYNNYKYVKNTIEQINKINPAYLNDIIVVDNCSTDKDTLEYLDTLKLKLIRNYLNNGPWIEPSCNSQIYNLLPSKFVLTDPDLQFNENLPSNFVEQLSAISDKYNSRKTGFALDISEPDKLYDSKLYANGQSIVEWESQFWKNKINDDNYELYEAPIDTTLHLYNKNSDWNKIIRVAGNFTAIHLPWYKESIIYSIDEFKTYCISTRQDITTMKRIILDESFKVNMN